MLARGLPLFAICRGTQETNVALGGSLHQAVQEVPGYADHRADPQGSAEVQYGLAHAVEVQAGGVLPRILDRSRFEVNSVHGQGVNRLARDLRVEARAPDGLIEAFSIPEAAGLQSVRAMASRVAGRAATRYRCSWHSAFGQACRAYRQQYREPLP